MKDERRVWYNVILIAEERKKEKETNVRIRVFLEISVSARERVGMVC